MERQKERESEIVRERSEWVCWEIYEKRKNIKENLSVDNCLISVWFQIAVFAGIAFSN